MNKINVNKTISIVKAVPVVLGLGVLAYKGVGVLSNKLKERKTDKKIKNTRYRIKQNNNISRS